MKKLMFALALLCAGFCYSSTNDTYTSVYDFKASISVPYLTYGIRAYKTQTFVGYMYMQYTEDGLQSTTIEMKNKTTKVDHVITSETSFYNLMGKSSKSSLRVTPSFWMSGADEDTDSHEIITTIALSGTGSLKSTKTVTTGCGVCGEPTKVTEYCNTLNTIKGKLVGVMDCGCPDDEMWDHTYISGYCGIIPGDLFDIRSHDASFNGTWTAKYNKKLTESMN